MSNFLAVATVTAAVQVMLQVPADAAVPGSIVSTERPDVRQRTPVSPGINLFLYEVRPNPSLRNADLPTRAADGRLVRRPRAALDLYYLLSFLGDETQLQPQRLLGMAVRTLHDRPTLTPDLIKAVVDGARAEPPVHPYLEAADLADQIERVTISPVALELEELSNLWSVFFQAPYVLSIAYKASVVLIDAEAEPGTVLPVLTTDVAVAPRGRPRIGRVVSAAGADRPIVATGVLAVHGSGLAGPDCRLDLGGTLRPPTSASDALVTLDLSGVPGTALRAGPQAVRVVHRQPGRTPAERPVVASDEARFTLHPTITEIVVRTGADAGATIRTDLPLGRRQRVLVLLLAATGEPRHLLEPAPQTPDDDADDAAAVDVALSGVPPGRYVVQLQVDGATSALDRDDSGRPTGPELAP